jgi:hypothetical protein
MQFQRVYPQGASQPITGTLRKDERTADQLKDLSGLNAQQTVVGIGDSVPIVFCSVTGDGGVWLAPPAVRWGFQNAAKDVYSCLALSMGEGPIGAVSQADVYKGDNTGVTLLSVSTTYGVLGSGCSFTTNIAQKTYDVTESYVATTLTTGLASFVPYGTPLVDQDRGPGPSTRITSKGDQVVAFSINVKKSVHNVTLSKGARTFIGNQSYQRPKAIASAPVWVTEKMVDPRGQPIMYTYKDAFGRDQTAQYEYRRTSAVSTTAEMETVNALDNAGQPIPNYSYSYVKQTIGISTTWDKKLVEGAIVPKRTKIAYDVYASGITLHVLGQFDKDAETQEQYQVEVTETNRYDYRLPAKPEFDGSGGSFEGLAILNVHAKTSTDADDHLNQVYAYIRQGLEVPRLLGGTGSSSMVADLFRYLLTRNNMVPASLIDVESLTLSAQFNQAEGLHFNGVLASATNFRDYFQRIAPFFLLTYTQTYGKPGLRPILPINASTKKLELTATSIRYAFTATEIIEGSLEYEYRSLEERKPFCALMLWRQQPAAKPGYERVTEVRYSGQAVDGPFEQYDLTEFCTSEAHALKVGKYLLALRRHSTHLVRFQVASTAAVMGLRPGDYITVTDSATPSLGGAVNKTETYVLTELMEEPTGAISVTAEHSPVDSAGISLITKDILGSTYSTR